MPNVTFKFVITETPLPADQDGRQQIIASISDDNAKRIMVLTGLAGEVEALKAHCHRMLNLARNRYLGYCDHNRAVQAIMEECCKMGMDQQPTQTDWHGEGTTPEADRVLLAMISILEHNGTIAPVIARDGREAISRLQCALPKARMHDDAHAMLDTLGIARRSENGADFTLQHRIGVLNDDAEREKGAAYRDAAAAESAREKLDIRITELISNCNVAHERLSTAAASIDYWMHAALGRETDGDDRDAELHRLATELEKAKERCRAINQAIVAEIGADGPDNAEAAVFRLMARLKEANSVRADQLIAINAYAEQRDTARQAADTLRCEVMEERNRREKSDSIAKEAAKQRDRLKELATEALIALKREWPQHALWRAQSPEAEPIRRLAATVGVELAP